MKLLYARSASEALLAQQEENQLYITDRVASITAEHIGESSKHWMYIRSFCTIVMEGLSSTCWACIFLTNYLQLLLQRRDTT